MLCVTPTIVTTGDFRSDCPVDWHNHPGPELVLVVTGRCSITVEGSEPVLADEGELYVLPPIIPHRADPQGFLRALYVVFEPLPDVFDHTLRLVDMREEQEFQRWLEWICLRYLEGDSTWRAAVESLLLACLRRVHSIEGHKKAHQSMHPRLYAAVRELQSSFTEIESLDDLAHRVGTSTSLLKMLFRKELETSPMKYRNQLRISKAMRLLSSPQLRVSEVAEMCGFTDVNYFVRYFRQVEGIAPGEWRRKHYGDAKPVGRGFN